MASRLQKCLLASIHFSIQNIALGKETECVEKKNQLDATERFNALIICSTCFGHFYANHQGFFPCFFLSCKANARIKLAKTGHGPHSSELVVICVVLLLFVLFCCYLCCSVVISVVLCTVCV